MESDDPRVRCGECLNIFNAQIQLVAEDPFAEPAVPMVTQKVEVAREQLQPAVTQRRSPAVELENYITADDLENATTLALDGHRQQPESGTSAAGINDGFYSPDLQINPAGPVGADRHPGASSEFEKTLAFEPGDDDSGQAAEAPGAPFVDAEIKAQTAVDLLDEPMAPEPEFADIDPQQELHPPAETGFERIRRPAAGGTRSALEIRRHKSRRGGELLSSESSARSSQSQQRSMLLPLVCIALALAAALYMARDSIARLDVPESVLTSFCGITGCELPPKQDLSRLELLQHRMNIHSKREDVLVINVDVKNNAPFHQPYPVLAVVMSDKDGGVVAERKFQPADYLDPSQIEQTLPPAEPVRIRFEIMDPGPEAVSSELEFE